MHLLITNTEEMLRGAIPRTGSKQTPRLRGAQGVTVVLAVTKYVLSVVMWRAGMCVILVIAHPHHTYSISSDREMVVDKVVGDKK